MGDDRYVSLYYQRVIFQRLREFAGGRPERMEVDIKLSCEQNEILSRGDFRIFAYAKGSTDQVGNALVGVDVRGSKPNFHLANLSVPSRYQGRGVSSQIMDSLEALIRSHGGTGSVGDAIKPGTKAAGMYTKRGWRVDGKRLVFP